MSRSITSMKSALALLLISFNLAAQEIEMLEPLALDDVVLVAESEVIDLQQSANAINTVELEKDQKLTADMGEVLSRVPGVSIRRNGGLGSRARFSLNGLRDDQIRFFIDGIPLSMSPYTFGISSIPVNLVERVDIYHGVVPIKFGADALAGAVNLITEKGEGQDDELNGAASLQYGDYNTLRSTLNLNYSQKESGFFTRFNAFSDSSDNDYKVDVTVPDDKGRQQPIRVKRFHDAYSAQGANLDLGMRNTSWAELFQVSLYHSEYFKEIQHSRNMKLVYGEPEVERDTQGINLVYRQALTENLELELAGGHAKINTHFIDVNEYKYNWLGQKIITESTSDAEMGKKCDCLNWRENQIGRINLDWSLQPNHKLSFSIAPSWSDETGENRVITGDITDWFAADREMFSLVLGASYTADVYNDAVENTLFIKRYSQDRKTQQVNYYALAIEEFATDINRMGWGNQSRYRFNDYLFTKFSYEYATRLPRAEEAFGDSISIDANPELKEEVSHNFNLSLILENLPSRLGLWRMEGNYFIRDVDDLISLQPKGGRLRYENVASVESEGIHGSLVWTSPSDFINLDANVTAFDFRNKSTSGFFKQYQGSRMPNVPYFFFNAALGLNWMSVLSSYDELNLRWHYKYVEEFSVFWDDVGLDQFNSAVAIVPAQETHSLSLTYAKDINQYGFSLTAEVQNLTDEILYDYFGVQRPGRTFNVKTIFEF